MINYELIAKDYEINGTEDDEMLTLKLTLDQLTPVEKKIFLTYAELGTYSATARVYNVSPPTIKHYINDIRIKIKSLL